MLVTTFAMVPSAFAGGWVEGEFETCGPRADRIRFNYYDGPDPEWVALEGHDIDITDWPLTKSWVDKWKVPPYSDYIQQDWYGGERGMFCLDVNQNETMPDGSYNPLGDPYEITMTITVGPDAGKTYTAGRGEHFLHAICHLLKRDDFITTVLMGLGEAVYAWMPSFYGDNVYPTPDQHPYSPTEAAEILDLAGFVDTDANTWRNDPVTGNDLNMDFVYRFQHIGGRKELGEWLALDLEAIDVDVSLDPKDGAGAFAKVMVAKNFHLYTGGWSLGYVPDHMYALFHSDYYWDSGMFCLNYGHHQDAQHDYFSELVYYAPDPATAKVANWDCQENYVDPEHIGPPSVWSAMAPKAHHITYTDASGENPGLKGIPWTGLVNEPGFGINSYLSFLNMHPEGVETGGTIEYGSYVSGIPGALNPFYASWYPDYEVIGKVYDSLLLANPYDPTKLEKYMPWLAKFYEVGTWENPDNPDFPTSTKLTFYLRDDVVWHDGTPFTSADVAFTIDYALTSADVDWYPSVADIHHFDTPDAYTIIIYENVLSCWAINWVGIGFPVAPKHIWEPIIATGDPYAFCPDKTIIGTGPFKVYPHSIDPADHDYYEPEGYLILDKNPAFYYSYEGQEPYSIEVIPTGCCEVDAYISDTNLARVTQKWVFYIAIGLDAPCEEDPGVAIGINTKITVAGGWGFTSLCGLKCGATYWICAIESSGRIWMGQVTVPNKYSSLTGDLTTTSLMPPRDPPMAKPFVAKVDWRDLFWFLKAYGQINMVW